jgi:hexosaminidase
METTEHVEEMVLPRMCALAEVVWSEKEQRNWHDFRTRLSLQYARFDALNLKYHRHSNLYSDPSIKFHKFLAISPRI